MAARSYVIQKERTENQGCQRTCRYVRGKICVSKNRLVSDKTYRLVSDKTFINMFYVLVNCLRNVSVDNSSSKIIL